MSPTALGIVLALAATLLEGAAQFAVKKSALALGSAAWRWSMAAIALFVVEALVYTLALRWLDVAVAYGIGALSFVVVALASRRWLGERVDGTRWAGLGLIALGAAILAARA